MGKQIWWIVTKGAFEETVQKMGDYVFIKVQKPINS